MTGNPVGDVFDHRKIVRNEDVGESDSRLPKIGQQVEHLRADRNIECRDRLVTDDQLRLNRKRACDRDPLPLASGEFVRVASPVPCVEPDQTQQFGDAIAPARSWNDVMQSRAVRRSALPPSFAD